MMMAMMISRKLLEAGGFMFVTDNSGHLRPEGFTEGSQLLSASQCTQPSVVFVGYTLSPSPGTAIALHGCQNCGLAEEVEDGERCSQHQVTGVRLNVTAVATPLPLLMLCHHGRQAFTVLHQPSHGQRMEDGQLERIRRYVCLGIVLMEECFYRHCSFKHLAES